MSTRRVERVLMGGTFYKLCTGRSVHVCAVLPEQRAGEDFDNDDVPAPAKVKVEVDAQTMQMAQDKLQKLKPRLGIETALTKCTPPDSDVQEAAVKVVLIRAKGLPSSELHKIRLGVWMFPDLKVEPRTSRCLLQSSANLSAF